MGAAEMMAFGASLWLAVCVGIVGAKVEHTRSATFHKVVAGDNLHDIGTKEEQRFVTVGKVGPSYVMQRRDALPAHVRKCLLRIGASE